MLLPLETFRGAFALVIVLHHLKINTFIHTSNFIQNGGLVVDFFFVLCGFIIVFFVIFSWDANSLTLKSLFINSIVSSAVIPSLFNIIILLILLIFLFNYLIFGKIKFLILFNVFIILKKIIKNTF